MSPKAYEVMRESGISLPTRRTLNDYTHWISAEPGFSSEVDDFPRTEAKIDELEDWQRFVTMCTSTCILCWLCLCCMYMYHRYVVLILDEMKVREDLVYDKTGEVLHGFVRLGDVNNQLRDLEMQANTGRPHESIATQMLTLIVRGVFIKLEFPYANPRYRHAQVCIYSFTLIRSQG